MSFGFYDLHKAVGGLWDTSGLDDDHTVYWTADQTSRYRTLQESGAVAPGTPFPYTTFREGIPNVVSRSSGSGNARGRLMKEIPWEFRVRARHTEDDAAKTISSSIAESIMTVFGPHPSTAPSEICLDTGAILRIQYQFDRSLVEDFETHSVFIMYTFLIDTPVEL